MADDAVVTAGANTGLPAGTKIAADNVAGVLFQVMKLDTGGDGVSAPVDYEIASQAKQDEIVASLASILGQLSADPATETTLAAVAAALATMLSSGIDVANFPAGFQAAVTNFPATQPISAAALPLPAGAATDAKVDTLIAKDFATQTTLAQLLAKVIAAPSTEARQVEMITLLTAISGYVDGLEGKDFATQATLAALLASLGHGTKTVSRATPVAATAGQLLAANANRKEAILKNNAANTIYLGKDATVTAANGFALAAGETMEDDRSTDAWWGITVTGAGEVHIIEIA